MKTNKELIETLKSLPPNYYDRGVWIGERGGTIVEKELFEEIKQKVMNFFKSKFKINERFGVKNYYELDKLDIYAIYLSKKKTAVTIQINSYYTQTYFSYLDGVEKNVVHSVMDKIRISDFINPLYANEYESRAREEKLKRTREAIEKEMVRLGKLLKEEENLMKEIKEEGN